MCAPSGPGGKQTTSPSPSSILAALVPDGDAALEHDEPLLVRVLVVVRADALPGWQLVERRAHLLAPERRAEPRHPGAVPLRVRVVVLGDELAEVDALQIGHAGRS